MQLATCGAKGSTRVPGKAPTSRWNPATGRCWALRRSSALDGVSDWSRAMTRADMDRVRDDFVRSTRRAAEAGFDWLELHCAHGYLLSSFISPADQPAHRRIRRLAREPLRYPLEVFRAMRAVWPQDKPMSRAHLGARLGRPAASRPTTRWRSLAPSRTPAPT
jgi:anthraniloyl-CoA monooxygenase